MKDADLKYWKKGRFLMSSGKTIIIETDIWLVPEDKRSLYPDGLKFGWVAFNIDNPWWAIVSWLQYQERISLSSWQESYRKTGMNFSSGSI